MTPRRSHVKSRRGCDTCRDRRVKCDETGPPCYNCTARQITCTYHKARLFSDKNHQAVVVPTSTSFKITRDLAHRRELELLHQYSTSTYESLTRIFEVPDHVWRRFAMQQAFNHDFLLNGILSLAASHIASEAPMTRHEYLITAAEYLELALVEFRPSLNAITDNNAHAVYVFGMVLCTSLFSRLESSVKSMSWADLLCKLNSIYECLSGVSQTIATSLEVLRESSLEPILARLEAKQTICLNEDVHSALLTLQALVAEYCTDVQSPMEQVLRYEKMIGDLKACWSHQVFVIDWLTNTSKEFQANLRRGNVIETLLLAHWGIAVCSLKEYWFIKELGVNISQMALNQINPIEPRFQQSVLWVTEQMRLNQ